MEHYDKVDIPAEIKRLPMQENFNLLVDYWSKYIKDWLTDAEALLHFAKDAADIMWIYAAYMDKECVGVLVNEERIDSSAVWLLHVAKEFRCKGIGSSLFSEALKYTGGKWTAGIGTGYWWQGVPVGFGDEFLEKRGFQWTWTSIDMILPLGDCVWPGNAKIAAKNTANFSTANVNTANVNTANINTLNTNSINISTLQPYETDALIQMMKEEKDLADWVGFYEGLVNNRKLDSILVARTGNQLTGCAILLEGDEIRWGKELGGKVGGIGCIGVKEKFREHGIGTALVSAVNERLKSSGYWYSYVGYTWLEDWYGTMGYQVYKRFRMGERKASVFL
jgi:beta-N-acetylhexosaminidase